jgi:hypothetical protein
MKIIEVRWEWQEEIVTFSFPFSFLFLLFLCHILLTFLESFGNIFLMKIESNLDEKVFVILNWILNGDVDDLLLISIVWKHSGDVGGVGQLDEARKNSKF